MRQVVAWYKNFLFYHAMRQRKLHDENSVGRSKISVGRDEASRPMEYFFRSAQ
jgi:hypothetical protein